jgi:hypothetical protein
MNRRQLGTAAAAAAFALLAVGAPLTSVVAAQDGGVKCAGVNSCKGQGWVTKSSAEECTAAGGKVIP